MTRTSIEKNGEKKRRQVLIDQSKPETQYRYRGRFFLAGIVVVMVGLVVYFLVGGFAGRLGGFRYGAGDQNPGASRSGFLNK